MKRIVKVAVFGLPLMIAATGVFSSPASAQVPGAARDKLLLRPSKVKGGVE